MKPWIIVAITAVLLGRAGLTQAVLFVATGDWPHLVAAAPAVAAAILFAAGTRRSRRSQP